VTTGAPPPPARPRWLRTAVAALGVVGVVAVVAYPVAVWLGLSRLAIRPLALVLLAVLLPTQLARLRLDRRQILSLLPVPAGVAALLVLAAVVEDRRFVLSLPVLVNAVLLTGFAASLRSVPLVERFARAQVGDDLSAGEVRYCRTVTLVWSAFFLGNALVSLALALFGTVAAWTLWCGLLSYVAMGCLFAAELVVRKVRFRRLGPGPLDRLLARLLPAR
jgi:uncharacterized membrane protein